MGKLLFMGIFVLKCVLDLFYNWNVLSEGIEYIVWIK